ncbi:MAG TPA: AraC family transcriptional regulator, partial [Polyangiaceae bacterium]|nr:AraC family transcriptional regulator [Polyangiaceae bacterium]
QTRSPGSCARLCRWPGIRVNVSDAPIRATLRSSLQLVQIDRILEQHADFEPRTVFSKRISGAGRWGVRYSAFEQPSFAAVLEGRCRLAVDGHRPLTLEAGDFVLLPATPGFTMSGFEPAAPTLIDAKAQAAAAKAGEVRHGTRGGRLLGGYFVFDAPDHGLLVSLLPAVIHMRGVERLSTLVRLVGDEAPENRDGRELILSRLIEVLLVEALRASTRDDAPPGLLRGLADPRLAPALRQMHRQIARSWTVSELTKAAALSRSTFFERFSRTVGLPPMEYLLAWRMAVAKNLLRKRDLPIGDVRSASATPLPAPSAPPSAATSAKRRFTTRAPPRPPAPPPLPTCDRSAARRPDRDQNGRDRRSPFHRSSRAGASNSTTTSAQPPSSSTKPATSSATRSTIRMGAPRSARRAARSRSRRSAIGTRARSATKRRRACPDWRASANGGKDSCQR